MRTLQRFYYFLIGIVLTFTLSGCGAEYYSIHHKNELMNEHDAVFSVDAKQRFLISTTNKQSKKEDLFRRYCAEPSPDIFSVLGQAFSGEAAFSQSPDPAALELALKGAFSSSETGSTIQRTQTINMLKEMMYRTCERYLNGQIDDLESPIIAARDQRIMTSILAIEQLTGSITPRPLVISSTATASTGGAGGDAILKLDSAQNKREAREKEFETAKKEFEKLNGEKGVCVTLLATKPDLIKDEDRTKFQDCKEKKEAQTKADQELDKAKKQHEAMLNLAKNAGASSVATEGALLSSEFVTEAELEMEKERLKAVEKVSSTVREIVFRSFDDTTETQFFCYSVIRKNIIKDPEVRDTCLAFLAAKTKADADKFMEEFLETKQKIEKAGSSRFDKFWSRVASSGQLEENDLVDVIDAVLKDNTKKTFSATLTEIKSKQKRDEIKELFKSLPRDIQLKLAGEK